MEDLPTDSEGLCGAPSATRERERERERNEKGVSNLKGLVYSRLYCPRPMRHNRHPTPTRSRDAQGDGMSQSPGEKIPCEHWGVDLTCDPVKH